MSKLLNGQRSQNSTQPVYYDSVVVGAGPYGLSTAAHLLEQGLKVAVLGEPLQLWREHMPKGMLLRSYWWATNLADPHRQYGLAQYFRETGQQAIDPLPGETFVEYGLWFQRHVVPDVDETYVDSIERQDGQFVLTLVDGRVLGSSTVVMAPGLRYYAFRPAEYDHLSSELVSHSSDHHVFDRFAGKQVVVIGGGQGALETAALAHESGAIVQVISRSPIVWIRGSGSAPTNRTLRERIRNPKAGISYGWFSWGLEHFPYAFQRLPQSIKDELLHGRGRFGPMGASWLKPRVEGNVHLQELLHVQELKEIGAGVKLVLSNNRVLKADHVILGTGYRVDVRNLPMLHPSILSNIQIYKNAAVLNNHFESSVPGLYFVGISSVSSCGPLYRFVVGTESAARRVAEAVAWQVKRGNWEKWLVNR
jgi:FAD-dependent urate hydroxylase